MIYLDNAASTRPKKEVVNIMVETMDNNYANPDAIHEFSHEIGKKIKKSREIIGRFSRCKREQGIFYSRRRRRKQSFTAGDNRSKFQN